MLKFKTLLQSKIFFFVSFVFLISYLFLTTKLIQYYSNYNSDTNYIEGKVLDYKIDGNQLTLTIKGKEKLIAYYYFTSEKELEEEKEKIELGSIVGLKGTLVKPNNNTIPNTFNYRNYLYYKKIFWTMNVSEMNLIENNHSILYSMKNKIIARLNQYDIPYLYAFILGKTNYIDSNLYDIFKENGVTHLFAVSGMHITFLVTFLEKMLKKRKGTDILILLFLVFYMFLVGFTASVVRASLLYLFLKVNKKMHFDFDNKLVLYFLFFFLLIINPFYIYDLGFQYSFLTSFGLILFAKKMKGNYFKKLLQVSFIATLFSVPISLFHFCEINLFSIINNLIVVPLVSIVLFPFSILTFFFSFLAPLLKMGFYFLEWLSIFLNRFRISVVVPKINILFLILYYTIIYIMYKTSMKKGGYLILLILIYKILPILDNQEYIYFLDVGQGDAAVIITEHRQDVVLIDTGGSISYNKEEWQEKNHNDSMADYIILFLKSMGITKLDLLIATHGDTDHIGYASEIIKEIKVKHLMLNNNQMNFLESDLKEMIPSQIKDTYDGKNIRIANLNNRITSDENESSLVLYVKLKEGNLLLMGDAPKSVENEILTHYSFDVNILKLGHHGSNTSSDYLFLKVMDPRYAIISCGRKNRYGHPSTETIASLQKLNISYFNTQDKGTIEFKWKNGKEKINFFAP